MNSLWALIAGLAGGVLVSALMPSPKAPKEPLLAPEMRPQGQPNREPNYAAAYQRNEQKETAGPTAGLSSTFLTGASGVDPNTLKLGRNKLLGS